MIEAYLYNLHCGKSMFLDRARNFFQDICDKGYLVQDIGKVDKGGIEVCNKKYLFDEIEKVPIKVSDLEEKIK